jgi:hypothetical protein
MKTNAMMTNIQIPILAMLVFLLSCNQRPKANKEEERVLAKDPLPSWNEGTAKKAIIDFINKTTKEGSADFIPVSDRIACFDNDGTLWSEQPLYFQFVFALDRVKTLASQHPEWKSKQPFKGLLEGDMKSVMAGGERALMEIVVATHSGMTTNQFEKATRDWMATARHPKTGKRYDEMIFLPMVELLRYLRDNNFKTFIVSGGEEAFMCPWVDQAYGIPCEQVIGTTMKIVYEVVNDTPRLSRLPELNFIDDGKGKPVGIQEQIGKRPVFTAGNSDGDYEMLQWTTTATGYPRFGMIIHHTDSVREWAYDRMSHIGHLERGLDDATKYNWLVVNMKNDWREIYVK